MAMRCTRPSPRPQGNRVKPLTRPISVSLRPRAKRGGKQSPSRWAHRRELPRRFAARNDSKPGVVRRSAVHPIALPPAFSGFGTVAAKRCVAGLNGSTAAVLTVQSVDQLADSPDSLSGVDLYPAHARMQKSLGEMMRKLSDTSPQ